MSNVLVPGKPWQILQGDVRRVAKTLPSNYFHASLCDPPYGLSFMGRRWDYSVPSAMVWSEIERVLIPGAHAMIFGGPRTFHRVAIAVEDGSFEMRDLLMWFFGSGYPKSLNVSKALDKIAGVKPKVIGQRDTGIGNGGKGNNFLTENSRNRIVDVTEPVTLLAKRWAGFGTGLKPGYEPVILARKMTDEIVAENVRKYGVGAINIAASRVGESGGTTYTRTGPKAGLFGVGGRGNIDSIDAGRWPANVIIDAEVASDLDAQFDGASRFYYNAKADQYQRDAGIEPVENEHGNTHPTVKPIDLIRYLAKMILPPPSDTPRRILVPYSGSGSEMIGCIQAGWDEVVGIEREAQYIEFATKRIQGGGVFSGLMDKKMRRRKAVAR
jgi:hypothetical protein